MSYEFASETHGRFVSVPDFWRLAQERDRVYNLMPSDPVFVEWQTIVEDPETGYMAIDTNDSVLDLSKSSSKMAKSVGLLKVMLPESDEVAYIADLRYVKEVHRRKLNISNDSYDNETADYNEKFKTQPVSGVVFCDTESSELHFRCGQDVDSAALRPYAESLMKFVDAERIKHGDTVLVAESEAKKDVSKSQKAVDATVDLAGYWVG